ncbi:MAG: diadenylate cyclase CdaA [Planctomycetota bacterium]
MVYELIRSFWKPALEIGILFAIIYTSLRLMQGTRGAGIVKGLTVILVIVFLILYYLSQRFYLEQISFLLGRFLETAVFALIIIFQPELRRALVRLGQTPIFGSFIRSGIGVTEEIEKAVVRFSKNRVGALIVIERNIGLNVYVEGGLKIDAEVKSELLDSIFYPGSSLHDGAIIIQNGRVAAAGCLLPLSENPGLGLGTRHRAGVGITEDTDAVSVIVSEESGKVSLAVEGKLFRGIEFQELRKRLRDLYVQRE